MLLLYDWIDFYSWSYDKTRNYFGMIYPLLVEIVLTDCVKSRLCIKNRLVIFDFLVKSLQLTILLGIDLWPIYHTSHFLYDLKFRPRTLLHEFRARIYLSWKWHYWICLGFFFSTYTLLVLFLAEIYDQ
ncbi:hypothetical protein MKX01_014241, partial [Papaver californicum]